MKITHNAEGQDMIGILIANGHSLEQILGLGFIVPVNQDVTKLSVGKKQNLYSLNRNLHVIISEVMKSPKRRNVNKILSYLNEAIRETDSYFDGQIEDNFLFHGLSPNFK